MKIASVDVRFERSGGHHFGIATMSAYNPKRTCSLRRPNPPSGKEWKSQFKGVTVQACWERFDLDQTPMIVHKIL
jgi:hypothetical protein